MTSHDSPIQQIDASWRLLPASPFPLTIEGPEAVMKQLDRALAAGAKDRVFTLLSKYDVRCREVEAWVSDFRESFWEAVERQRKQSTEYQALLANPEATKSRRRKMDATFKKAAYLDLHIRPGHDYSAVFEEAKEDRLHAVVDLLMTAYTMSQRAAEREQQHRDLQPSYWLITTGPNACTFCQQFEGKHPASYRARIPIHIGCTCQITGHQ